MRLRITVLILENIHKFTFIYWRDGKPKAIKNIFYIFQKAKKLSNCYIDYNYIIQHTHSYFMERKPILFCAYKIFLIVDLIVSRKSYVCGMSNENS